MNNYLIVGGTKGIGKEIVNQLDGNKIIVSRTPQEEVLPNSTYITGDVTDVNFKLDIEIEQLDGVIYCPGTINLRPFTSMKRQDFLNDFEVNLLGAVNILQQSIKYLKKSENASVVMFSTVAVKLGMPFHSSIAASKAAVEGLTKSLAAEYAPKIRFNCIAPSLTDTDLAKKLLSNEKVRESSLNSNPMKQIGDATDLASLAVWLLSDNAKWFTGQIINFDGGMSSLK